MANFLRQLRTIGWAAVEAAFLVVVLCLLLNIIIGDKADSFISTVAKNATAFLQSLPPGIFLGLVLLVLIYGFLKSRLQPPH
jgi:ABC-type dipeptide/oligopeptide/nickel transport system permease component